VLIDIGLVHEHRIADIVRIQAIEPPDIPPSEGVTDATYVVVG
jgi:hypothetical protein